MNEPTPPDTRINPPPVPWLGQEPTTTKQPWSPISLHGATMTVKYRFHPVGYRRCRNYLMRTRYLRIIASVLGNSFFVTVLFVAFNYYSTKTFLPKFSLVMLLFAILWHLLMVLFGEDILSALVARKNWQVNLLVLPDFIYQQGTPSPCLLKWTKIARIVERDGDLYFLPKLFGGTPFAVPQEAFVDADSAKRFHAAVVTIWNTGGVLDAVPDAVRAEFAPEQMK